MKLSYSIKDLPKKKETNKKRNERQLKEYLDETGYQPSKIGYAFFFENIVVYGDPRGLGKRIKSQLGELLGVVYGKIPNDHFCILYSRIFHTKSWIKRKGNQKNLKSFIYTGKPRIFVKGVQVQ